MMRRIDLRSSLDQIFEPSESVRLVEEGNEEKMRRLMAACGATLLLHSSNSAYAEDLFLECGNKVFHINAEKEVFRQFIRVTDGGYSNNYCGRNGKYCTFSDTKFRFEYQNGTRRGYVDRLRGTYTEWSFGTLYDPISCRATEDPLSKRKF